MRLGAAIAEPIAIVPPALCPTAQTGSTTVGAAKVESEPEIGGSNEARWSPVPTPRGVRRNAAAIATRSSMCVRMEPAGPVAREPWYPRRS